jgi:hypothetical protein
VRCEVIRAVAMKNTVLEREAVKTGRGQQVFRKTVLSPFSG